MDGLVLRLLPDNQEPQELVLQKHRLSNSILDTANAASSFVFNDYKYHAQLLNVNQDIINLTFLLNGQKIDITYSPDNGKIFFQDYDQRIFLECYGFVQITIIFEDAQGITHIKDTEYIHVMVRKGRQNDSVRCMTEYVYRQNAELLNGNQTLPKDSSGLKESARKTIESHILLLEQISVIYEENYRYFKLNSRFSTVPKERVDHFEKLQYVSRNTLQFIVQHPEELQQIHHSSGINIRGFRYQPNKTLITDNEKSYDIYENRFVLGFLMCLLNEVERIQKELSDVISRVPQKLLETDDYITSSYFIYAKTIEVVRVLLNDVQKLHRKYTSLYYLYSKIFPFKAVSVTTIPHFTPLFKSIPQYHQIFECAVSWFTKGVFTIQEEQFMLSFIKISTLYEVYVLTKIINYFRNNGYSLVCAEKILYPSPGKYYENTFCNNRFILKNDSGQITVYYQPVIYNSDRQAISGIGLYRNTSISFPKSRDGSSYQGRYYTPDFLIKYDYLGNSISKYLIADAKFSRLQTVKEREFAELSYKYLFSVSPVSPEAQIIGLCIFNGLLDSEVQKDLFNNAYDFELEYPIVPNANFVTITGNDTEDGSLHEALLRNSVGLYTTPTTQNKVEIPINPIISSPETDLSVAHTIPTSDKSNESEIPVDTIRAQTDNTPIFQNSTNYDETSATAVKSSQKKAKKVDANDIAISELLLGKEIELRLNKAGYITVQDLVPNKAKSDLTSNALLNRKSRREIEARLKQRKIYLA